MKLLTKKTTIMAILFIVTFVLTKIFGIEIPEWVFGIIASLGFAAFRFALQKINGNAGWKSYATAAVVGGISLLTALGVGVSPEMLETIYAICGALGFIGVRDAVKQLE